MGIEERHPAGSGPVLPAGRAAGPGGDLLDAEPGRGPGSPGAGGEAPELAAAVVELCPDGILVIGPDGAVCFANPAAEAILGHPAAALLGMRVEDLVPQRLRAAHVAHRLAYSDAPAPRPMGLGRELWALRPDGEEVAVQNSLSPASVAGGLHTIVVIRDVSKHRASEAATQAALLTAEQDRIAADLHNRVIDGLFGAGMGIQSVMRRTDGAVAGRLAEVVDQIDEVIRAIRATVFDRRPNRRT